MIEGFENFDPVTLWQSTISWCMGYIIQPHTLYQGVIILGSFFLGLLIHRAVKNHVRGAIKKLDIPYRVRKIINNLEKLLFPFITLTVIFFVSQIAGSDAIRINISILTGIMKVLMAWIGIRIIVQFIENNAARNILAMGIWAVAALSIFGMLDRATEMLDAIGFTIGDFKLSALAVIKSGFYLFILLYFATFISSLVERRILKTSSLTRSSQVLISKIIRVALIVFALLIAITSSGIDLSLFAVFGGAIGLGIGFGLQKGISNLFSGILLLIDRSIKPGDVIELENGTFGWVNSMAARYTEIVTRDNKSFLIPNEEFITQRVVNWSHGNSLIRLDVNFGVHYDSDPHDVIKLAIKAATGADERICETPEAVCHLTEFGDSSINFTLRFWIKDAEKGITNIRGIVMLALWDALKENNVNIPYPHREVYIHETKIRPAA